MTEVLSRSPSTWNFGTTTELSQNVAAGVSKPAVPGGGRMLTKTVDEEEVEDGAAETESRRV